MAENLKTARVLTGAKPPLLRPINIVTSQPHNDPPTFPTWNNTTQDDRRFETVYDTGGQFPGIKTVCIPGYSTGGGGSGLLAEDGSTILSENGVEIAPE